MIGKLLSIVPYMLCPAVFFISAFLGITLLFQSKDALIDKYQGLIYRFVDHVPSSDDKSYDQIVLAGRLTGVAAIAICLLTGYFTTQHYLL